MPYILKDLVIDRVDLVDEGANSAAFIELYKRKEQEDSMDFNQIIAKMKPEHAQVITELVASLNDSVTKAKEDCAAAQADLATVKGELDVVKSKLPCECEGDSDEKGVCKACGKPKTKTSKTDSFDEEETLKAMPEHLRNEFIKMRTQKEAAEAEVRKAAEQAKEAEAVAKAASLKSLPVEQTKLVGILKSCGEDVVDALTAINAAIESTVLTEVGKSTNTSFSKSNGAAWEKIEAQAETYATEKGISKAKAISEVIKQKPELYKEYLGTM